MDESSGATTQSRQGPPTRLEECDAYVREPFGVGDRTVMHGPMNLLAALREADRMNRSSRYRESGWRVLVVIDGADATAWAQRMTRRRT